MTDIPFLTIFTPTYNRAHTLDQLYASLCQQTCKEFMWLIVDDGSTDETETLVASWISEGKIRIIYHKQANGGKQRAHNTGVALCQTEAFQCVDSDDYMVDDAVATLKTTWKKIREMNEVSGIIALRGKDMTHPTGTHMPEGITFCPLSKLYQSYGFEGETQLTFKTSILKRFPYDVADGEKFITESYVYLQIDQSYTMFLLNDILAVGGYQEDGYTKSIHQVIFKNPKSYMKLKKLSMDLAPDAKHRFADAIRLLSAYFILHRRERNFPWNLYTMAAYLPGYVLYLYRFSRYVHAD